jgi:hypothetical protein
MALNIRQPNQKSNVFVSDSSNMRCPCCNSYLIVTGQERLETLDEHIMCSTVSLKNKYECPDENCEVNTSLHICWNRDGECYYEAWPEYWKTKDKNMAPFNSFQRRINVEIYKLGVKDKKRLSPAWCLWIWYPVIEYVYKADDDGNVISKGWRMEFWKQEKDMPKGCFTMVHLWPRTWKYLWKSFHGKITIGDMEDQFARPMNSAFPYRAFRIAMIILYWRRYLKYKK